MTPTGAVNMITLIEPMTRLSARKRCAEQERLLKFWIDALNDYMDATVRAADASGRASPVEYTALRARSETLLSRAVTNRWAYETHCITHGCRPEKLHGEGAQP